MRQARFSSEENGFCPLSFDAYRFSCVRSWGTIWAGFLFRRGNGEQGERGARLIYYINCGSPGYCAEVSCLSFLSKTPATAEEEATCPAVSQLARWISYSGNGDRAWSNASKIQISSFGSKAENYVFVFFNKIYIIAS